VTDQALVAAAQGGDEAAFAELTEPHRQELHVHCYRMLGSFDESEDLVQETFLRAWRARASYEGRSTFRAWLYRIATNACLDFLRRYPRTPKPYASGPGAPPSVRVDGPPQRVGWLQPFPESLLEVAAAEAGPDEAAIERETIELVFLAAIQHLPPKQRAALLLRDVLGWPAAQTAEALDLSVASVNSALQRARPAMREHLPKERGEWRAGPAATAEQRELLDRYLEFAADHDFKRLADLMREDIKLTMPPNDLWFIGRDSIIGLIEQAHTPGSPMFLGEWRTLPFWANRQPSAAHYVRRPGTTVFRPQVMDVLRVEDGLIAEITSFEPHLFPAFGLPRVVRR
jgi:RNA polymerase sigma-70 factor (ECF subfamily)